MNKYKILLILGISAYTSLIARENPFAKAYETQEVKKEITTEGVKTELSNKKENITAPKVDKQETKTLGSIEKELKTIKKKDPIELKNNTNNNQYIDGSPITEAVWEKLEKKEEKPIKTTIPLEKKQEIIEEEKKLDQKIKTTSTKEITTITTTTSILPLAPTTTITPIEEPVQVINSTNNITSDLPIIKSYPIPNSEIKYITEPEIVKRKKQKVKQRHVYKSKQNARYNTAFKNRVVTVQYANRSVKIITNSPYIKKRYFKNPRRVSFDFKRDTFFKSGSKYIKKSYANLIKVGAHGDFFRVTLNLKNSKKAIAHTRDYGLLVNFK